MGTWDNVEVGVGGDETVNFGPRKEAGSQLYQVDTNALVSARDEVEKTPHISCCATDERMLLAADQHLSIFAESCHEIQSTIAFDTQVDKLALTDDGSFAAVGEFSGNLHFIHCDSQQVLFTKNLLGDAASASGDPTAYQLISFSALSNAGMCSLLVVIQGQLHIFSQLDITALQHALVAKNWEEAKELQRSMSHKMVDVSGQHGEDVTGVMEGEFSWGQGLITTGHGRSVVCAWQWDGNAYIPYITLPPSAQAGAGVMKCALTQCLTYLVLLDDQGVLSLWLCGMMVCLRQWDRRINNFQLLEAEDSHGLQNSKVVLLCDDEASGGCLVTVCDLPTLVPVYTLQLGGFTRLAMCPTTQEALYLIEGVRDNDEGNKELPVDMLRIRCLTEAQPESRFSRMLHKKQFTEAEMFARSFKLDVELCHKVRGNHLLDLLSPWNAGKLSEAAVKEHTQMLVQCLNNITDDEHVVDCSVKAAPPTYEATRALLYLARDRLEKRMKEGMANKQCCFHLTQVMETLHRLGTYQMLYGISDFSAEKWDSFRQANMLSIFLRFMSEGSLMEAFTVWGAHQCDFGAEYTVSSVEDILASIPEDCLSEEIQPWLASDLIPYTIRNLPDALSLIAVWIELRTAKMELSEATKWPHNALEFGQVLQNTCMAVASSGKRHHYTSPEEFTFLGKDSNMKLHRLLGQLRSLVRLHDKYNFKLGLLEFARETVESLTFRMLDRVAASEVIPATIHKLVRPYMQDHNLPQDYMLLKYIEDLLERCGKKRSYIGESSWEPKARAVVACIDNTQFKLEAVLAIMSLAYVPWSVDMQTLVDQALAVNHPLAGEVKERCRFVEVKKLLIEYGLREGRDYSLNETSNAERLVYFILKQDRATAIDDALHIANVYKNVSEGAVYRFRLQDLAMRNRLQEVSALLKRLPVEMALSVGYSVVTRAQVEINRPHRQECTDNILRHTAAACHVLQALLLRDLSGYDRAELSQDHVCLTAIHSLQREFGEYISITDYKKASFRKELLQKYLKLFFSKSGPLELETQGDPDRKPSKRKGLDGLKLHRLAVLLEGASDHLTGELAQCAARTGDVQTAISLARSLQQPDPASATILYQVVRTMVEGTCGRELVAGDEDLVQTMYELSCFAAVHCKPDLTREYAEFSRCLALVCSVLTQCENEEYGSSIKSVSRGGGVDMTSVDPFYTWTLSTMFSEEGLVMDSALLLPKAFLYVQACLSDTHKGCRGVWYRGLPSLADVSVAVKTMIQLLNENSHSSLALRYAMHSHGAAQLHMALMEAQAKAASMTGKAKVLEAIVQEAKASRSLIDNLQVTLVKKALRQSRIDQMSILGSLCSLPKAMAYSLMQKLVESMGHNYKRILCLGEVCNEFAGLHKDAAPQETSDMLTLNARWGHRLSQFKISFNSAYDVIKNIEEKRKLLPKLTQCEGVDLSTIVQYCSDFNIDKEEALYMMLQHLMLPAIKPGAAHNMHTCVVRAQQVLHQIENPMLPKFQNILQLLDPYDYERIGFVLRTLHKLDPMPETEKQLRILDFISCYKRLSPPSEFEIQLLTAGDDDEDEQMLLGNKELSPLAAERLPFHPMCTPQGLKIIVGELTETTVSIWLPAAPTLKTTPDVLYVMAINNMVTQHVKQKTVVADKSQCQWDEVTGVDVALFDSISRLLMSVRVAEDALMCASWVVKMLPVGAEKVAALRYSKLLAEKWLKACPEEGEERTKALTAYKRLSDIYRVLASEQILYKNRLGEADLLALVKFPARLTFKLYEHPSILERSTAGDLVTHLPDIHKVAAEVASLCNLDLGRIHEELVTKWLPSCQSSKQEDLDMTTTFNFGTMGNLDATVCGDEDLEEDVHNLKKVTYILQYGCLERNVYFLLNYAFKRESSSITNLCRSRALSCLFALVDTATIEKRSHMAITDVRAHRQTLFHLVELEQLQMPRSLEDFTGCKKEGLVRSIWRNHSHKQGAVRLVADLCLEYQIFDPNLWNSILQQLLAFQMMRYLREVLTRLSDQHSLWQVPSLQDAWKSILLSPLKSVVPPLAADQVDECFQSYALLFRCPMVLDMDVQQMARCLSELELLACAVGCSFLLPCPDQQTSLQQEVLSITSSSCPSLLVLQQLTDYHSKGYAVAMRDEITHAVFKHVHSCQLYDLLTSSPYLEDFMVYLVTEESINNYLVHLLVNDSLTAALKLMQLYQASHQEDDFPTQNQLDPVAPLRFYLETQGLLMEVMEHLPAAPAPETETELEVDEVDEVEHCPLQAPWEAHLT